MSKQLSDKRKRERALAIAKSMLLAIEVEHLKYRDIIKRGENPIEHGMRSDKEVLADSIIRWKLDIK